MLRSLWKLQWKQFAARMKKGNGKKTSGGWLAFLMLFLVVCMEILMFVGFAELVPLCEMGLTWLYFAMAGTVALAFSMLGSVFMTQAQLYDAKDNERLLSMPIPPKYILLTRIAILFTTTAGYTLAVLLPAFGIYAFSYGASATMIIGWLFTFVALSLISQSVCCALGWVLHKLLSRLRNKAVVSLLYMVIFMAVNIVVTVLALHREGQRTENIPPATPIDVWLDETFPDDWMQKRFENMTVSKDVGAKSS